MEFIKSKLILIFGLLCLLISTPGFTESKWKQIKGNASDVAVDEKGRLFVISSKKKQVYSWNVLKQKWDKIPKASGNVSKIAATKDGQLYGIVKSKVFIYSNKKWKQLGNFKASDIGAGVDGTIWLINRNKQIAKWDPTRKRWLSLRTSGTSIEGKKPRSIDVDRSGNPFVTFYDNSIAYYISARKTWKLLPGKAIDISCSSSAYVYAIDPSGAINWWNTKKQQWEDQNQFPKVDSPFKRISVLPNNSPWVLTQNGDIFHQVNANFSNFKPSKHGFHFSNSFNFEAKVDFNVGVFEQIIPKDYYSYSVNEPYGLCGGMSLVAHEYYRQNRDIHQNKTPPKNNTKLFEQLLDRQYVSFGDAPGYSDLRKAFSWWGSFESKEALAETDTKQELLKITKELDKNQPVQLVLIYQTKTTGSPWDNHQVLAYGYEKDYNSIRIFIYDPNEPMKDDIVITYANKGNGHYSIFQNKNKGFKKIYGMFPVFPKVKALK